VLSRTLESQQRPSPAVVRAKRHEIAVRYRSHKTGGTPKEIIRNRVRHRELERLFRDRYGPSLLPDDDAGREDLIIAIDHLVAIPRVTSSWIRNWVSEWAAWATSDKIMEWINQASVQQRRWTAEKLGRRLNLTDVDRTRLRITTIAPCDLSSVERANRKKRRKRERDRNRQRKKREDARRKMSHRLYSERADAVRSILREDWALVSRIAALCHFDDLSGRSMQRAVNRALNELLRAGIAQRRAGPRRAQLFRLVRMQQDPTAGTVE
jgi:hypothetical protein